jgi:hypothetical protein
MATLVRLFLYVFPVIKIKREIVPALAMYRVPPILKTGS